MSQSVSQSSRASSRSNPVAKILLVDDRRDNLVALEAMLQGMPVQPVAVMSGETALKKLLVDDFALILLDAHMPVMDGFETAHHIKNRQRTRQVPIIFLTAADREAKLALRGYAAGAVDYLTKPFDPWILRAKVSVFVDLWTKNRLLQQQADQLVQVNAAVARAIELLQDNEPDPDQAREVLTVARQLTEVAAI